MVRREALNSTQTWVVVAVKVKPHSREAVSGSSVSHASPVDGLEHCQDLSAAHVGVDALQEAE